MPIEKSTFSIQHIAETLNCLYFYYQFLDMFEFAEQVLLTAVQLQKNANLDCTETYAASCHLLGDAKQLNGNSFEVRCYFFTQSFLFICNLMSLCY